MGRDDDVLEEEEDDVGDKYNDGDVVGNDDDDDGDDVGNDEVGGGAVPTDQSGGKPRAIRQPAGSCHYRTLNSVVECTFLALYNWVLELLIVLDICHYTQL